MICAEKDVESKGSFFDDIHLLHMAIPDMSEEEIDLSVDLFGKKLSMPLIIASMTGGHPRTKDVNAALSMAVEELQIGMGVGSQRAALEDPKQEESFGIVRDLAPSSFIYANIGAAQLREYGLDGVERAIEMVDANAIAIHLNFLQEAVQSEGETNTSGCIDMIREICSSTKIPVIAKETGAGISHVVGRKLEEVGVSAIDVGGLGGTNWVAAEMYRSDKKVSSLGTVFRNWGIPTPVSIVECSSLKIPIIATGGIRTGLDMAKSIALGASLCSAALPFLRPAFNGKDEVIKKIGLMGEELRIAMFLCDCVDIDALKDAQTIVCGRTREMLEQMGRRP
jgi:isopentenyl-diphosphate delta-isomerase